jgi:hypothetical protein
MTFQGLKLQKFEEVCVRSFVNLARVVKKIK